MDPSHVTGAGDGRERGRETCRSLLEGAIPVWTETDWIDRLFGEVASVPPLDGC